MSIIASHNTMSYLKPAKWYMRLFNFVAQCQNKTIEEQLALGVRVFDLRIRFNHNTNEPYFAHGVIRYKGKTVSEVLLLLNTYEDCKVRLILETSKFTKHLYYQEAIFLSTIRTYLAKYKNIYFFEGTTKHTWHRNNYILTENTIDYVQYVGSMTKSWLYKIWPRFYSINNNRKIVYNKSNITTFIDFVGNYY